MAERVSQTAHLSNSGGSVPRDVEHPRDPPERRINAHSRYDTGCARQMLLSQMTHRVSISWHTSSAKPFCIARGSNRKVPQRRRTGAAPQECRGQIHQEEEDWIDIYEIDLAESMAMWGCGDHATPGQHCTAECRSRMESIRSPKAQGIFCCCMRLM